MSLRNEHMQKKYLETPKHPFIQFEVMKARITKVSQSDEEFQGVFTIKGTKKTIPIRITVEKNSSTNLHAKASFPIMITDFGISQPKFMVVKMEPLIQVKVDLRLRVK